MAGRGPGDDDDKAKWGGTLLIQYPFQAVVGLRDVATRIFGAYGYQLTPAHTAPQSFVNWAHSIWKAIEKEDASLLAKPTAEAIGYAYCLPAKQAIITLGNLWEWFTGNDPEFAVRDIFYTKRKDR